MRQVERAPDTGMVLAESRAEILPKLEGLDSSCVSLGKSPNWCLGFPDVKVRDLRTNKMNLLIYPWFPIPAPHPSSLHTQFQGLS